MMRKASSSRDVLQGFGDFRPELGPLRKRKRRVKLGAGVQLYEDRREGDDESAERCAMLRKMAQELSCGLRQEGLVTNHFWYHKKFAETFAASDAVRCVAEMFRRAGSRASSSSSRRHPLADEASPTSLRRAFLPAAAAGLSAGLSSYYSNAAQRSLVLLDDRTGGGEASPRPLSASQAGMSPEEKATLLMQELLDYGFVRRVSKRETKSSVGWEATEHVVRSKRRFKVTKHTLYRFDDDLSEIQLRVSVVGAERLGGVLEGIRKTRLVVRLETGGRVLETLAVKRSDRPEWHAHFVFGLDDQERTRRVLRDTDRLPSLRASQAFPVLKAVLVQRRRAPFGDKDLGSIDIPLHTLPRVLSSPAEAHDVARAAQFLKWYDLVPKKKQKQKKLKTGRSTANNNNNNTKREKKRAGRTRQTTHRLFIIITKPQDRDADEFERVRERRRRLLLLTRRRTRRRAPRRRRRRKVLFFGGGLRRRRRRLLRRGPFGLRVAVARGGGGPEAAEEGYLRRRL